MPNSFREMSYTRNTKTLLSFGVDEYYCNSPNNVSVGGPNINGRISYLWYTNFTPFLEVYPPPERTNKVPGTWL